MAAKPRFFFPLANAPARRGHEARSLGGKAAQLARLERAGLPVPTSWVCPAEIYAEVARQLPADLAIEALLKTEGRRSQNRVGRAFDAWRRIALPTGFDAEIERLWHEASDHGRHVLAVRSSATVEDTDTLSMAGVAASRIGVTSARELLEAVRDVWASLATPRAVQYLAHRGVRDAAMAVLVQRVIPARASGVLFTRHPLGGADRLVNATHGLGLPVVDGHAPVDSWRMDDRGRLVEESIQPKPTMTVLEGGSVHTAPNAQARDASLSLEDRAQLTDLALRLERLGGSEAWDTEFAFEGAALVVLQARPVTSRAYPRGGNARTVWSSANLAEALPGVATPLTWSVAGAFADKGFRAAFDALGCPMKKDVPIVGNVHGRFYLNLSQFMEIAGQVPWIDPRVLIELGGGAGGDELAAQRPERPSWAQLARAPFVAARLLETQIDLDGAVERYVRDAEHFSKRFSALDVAILPDPSLAKTFRELQELLDRTGTAMLTCAASSLGAYLALRLLLARSFPVEGDAIAQALTTGIADLASVGPAVALEQVARVVEASPTSREALASPACATPAQVPDAAVRAAIVSFLDRYGDRAIREAELAEPRWREDPASVFAMLRVALRDEDHAAATRAAQRQRDREARREELEQRLKREVSAPTLVAIRVLVGRTKKAASHRETMRSWVTCVLGRIREAALVADARLRRQHPDLDADLARFSGEDAIAPVFLLTVDEIVEALDRGRDDVVALVRARRTEWMRDRRRAAPPSTFVGAPPPPAVLPRKAHALRGIPVSAGVVEGSVRIVRSAAQIDSFLPGEILVTPTTDTAWTPLFLEATAVVTELGGALSHAAIVARELNVPAVVNVEEATVRLRDGDRVRVDGTRGVVELLTERTP
jgi:phosphohistidine swiveling domain-containing protein